MPEPKDVVAEILSAFEESRNSLTNRRDAFMQMWRNYKQVYESDDEEQFLNNVFSTITFETIETFRPYLTQIPPDLTVLPKPGAPSMDAAEAAKRVEDWQRFQWYAQGMDKKRKLLVFYMLLYGLGVVYRFYRKESREVEEKEFSQDGRVRMVKRTLDIYDDPDCEIVDIVNDFFPDPYGRSIPECNYIIYRRIMKKDQLVDLSKGDDPWYTNLPEIEELGSLYDDYFSTQDRSAFDRYSDCKEILDIAKQNLVETLEYWEDDRLVIVANRSHLLRDTDNPYYRIRKKPFLICEDYDVPHELWPVGEGEILMKIQHELNFTKRARLDFTKRKLKPGFFTPSGSGVDMAGYYNEEGYTIETPFPDAIKPIPLPDAIEGVSLQNELELKSDGENATAATPLMKGALQRGMNTATEGRIQQGNVMSRANYKVDNFSEFLKQWMEWNVALAAQYYPAERWFRVRTEYGFDVRRLPYEDLVRGLDFEVASASSLPMTRDDKLMMADVLFSRFYPIPEIDKQKLLSIVMRLMDVPDRQGLMKTPEVLAMEQQGAMQAAQAQQDAAINTDIAKQVLASGVFGRGGEE